MRFWDTSAIVPLISEETTTPAMTVLLAEDLDLLVWMFTSIELASALRRKSAHWDDSARRDASALLAAMDAIWAPIENAVAVEQRAREVLASHPLRSADALQLAAALVACAEDVRSLPFVTLDVRLAEAARSEGFLVLP